jgi:hypothetical protein
VNGSAVDEYQMSRRWCSLVTCAESGVCGWVRGMENAHCGVLQQE